MKKSETAVLFRGMDILCIALTVALSVLFLLFSQAMLGNTNDPVLKVEYNGETKYHSLGADSEFELTSRGISLTVTISDGSAWISHSTCPDGVCKSMGKINKNGQIAVCAPAHVAISVQNAEEEATDAITR